MTAPILPANPPSGIADFDFRRSDQLPTADIQDFRGVQEAFAERLAAELGGYFRAEFSILIQGVSQSTWGDYAARFTSPTCLMLLKAQALAGYGALELGPQFVFTILEILLGGKADSAPDTARELTAIEKKLLAAFFRSVQNCLQESWSVEGPDFALESVVSAPGLAIGILQDDPMVLAEFVVTVGGVDGYMCLAVPARFVRQRRQNPDAAAPTVPDLRQPGNVGAILTRIRTGTVFAETRLMNASIRMGDLSVLQAGDVLNLGYAISSPLSMCVNGAEVYSGFIVPVGDKRAFAIQSVRSKGSESEH